MNKEAQLYAEEQRKQLMDTHAVISELAKSIDELNQKYVTPPTELTVSGEVEVNTEKAVEVTNLHELSEQLTSLETTLAKAIADNSYKPVDTVTVKNIKDATNDTIKVTNLKELSKYFATLEKAIKANQPIVNVDKQVIELPTDPRKPIAVRLSDGKAFYNAVSQGLAGITFPSVMSSPSYATRITTSGSDTYVGEALPGTSTSAAAWRIQKIDTNGNITWKDGNDNFDNTATDLTAGSFS